MSRRVAEWLMIGALLVVVLAALAGCATTPAPTAFLCLPGRSPDGSGYLLCKALPPGALGSD